MKQRKATHLPKLIPTIFFALITFLFIALPVQAARVDDVKFFVEHFYYGDIPADLHEKKTIEEVIDSLDEYSRYLTAEEYSKYVASVGADDVALSDINTPAVSSSMLYGNIGYIRIKTFSANMDEEVTKQYNKLKKEGAKKLIIDLRYNGGGYVESAEKLLGHFNGVHNAYELTTREGSEMIKPVASKTKFPKQTYILVNRYSASASEIVAASVADQNAAVIVGERTKGKGTVQSFFEFEDGSALKLTVGKFTGPSKKEIHHNGVKPTIECAYDAELATIHGRLIHEMMSEQKYKTVTPIDHSPQEKTFHIHFTQKMNLKNVHASNKVELVKVGGIAVPIAIQPNGEDVIDITPKKPMERGGSYVLIVHPGFENQTGRTTKQGIYTPITVK